MKMLYNLVVKSSDEAAALPEDVLEPSQPEHVVHHGYPGGQGILLPRSDDTHKCADGYA